MMVASTIASAATFSPFSVRCRCTSLEQPPAQIMPLQQMAETAHRRLIRHRLAAEVGMCEEK